jgi:hypothetical protein
VRKFGRLLQEVVVHQDETCTEFVELRCAIVSSSQNEESIDAKVTKSLPPILDVCPMLVFQYQQDKVYKNEEAQNIFRVKYIPTCPKQKNRSRGLSYLKVETTSLI